MEELINKLAEMQEEINALDATIKGDGTIDELKIEVSNAEHALSNAKEKLDTQMSGYTSDRSCIEATIIELKDQLIDEWDGQKKTLKYPAGTLSFTTTGSLRVFDEVRLMEILIEKTSMVDVVSRYIKGFKLTAVKQYIGAVGLPSGVAKIEHKTTVRLKTE